MSDETDGVDWRKLRDFFGVAVDQSYILSWQLERDSLLADLDVALTKDHPFFERPRSAERPCIRPATLEFRRCARIAVNGQASDVSDPDTVARLGPGRIHDLRRFDEGPYEISGVFGTVLIDAERPVLRLVTSA